MAKFSDQIREAISTSGTSRYALAKQVGVSESALSRFMSGKQGLTLASLDKLAEVLGLRLITTVQRVAKRSPRGRKKKPSLEARTKMTKKQWQVFAQLCAADAYENHFSSRRGIWYFEDCDAIVIYNNHPYGDPALREKELTLLRQWLKKERIKELAFATYPEDGYSYTLVIDASRDREQMVGDALQNILLQTMTPGPRDK